MVLKSPEEELREFLESQPTWRRKLLERDFGFTDEEGLAWGNSDSTENDLVEARYLVLLRKVPTKWREYREKKKQSAMRSVPAAIPGRPRKDELASEAVALFEQGKAPGQIAKLLKPKFPDINKESVRKLLASRHVRRAEKK